MTMPRGFVDGAQQEDLVLTPEVCVIGSGAGGAVAAFHLQQAGHEVLVVEEGGHHTRKQFHMTEAESFPTLYQESGQRVTRDLGVLVLQGRAIGGTTVINWTTCFRTPDHVLEHWRVHHAVAGINAAALNPHWDAVEARLNIHQVPLAETNRNNRLLYDGCKALGWEASTTRRNVKDCRQSGYCGMGCPVDAKQSMLVTYLPDAVASGATILSRCRLEKLHFQGRTVTHATAQLMDAQGIAPTGKTVTIKARRFVLSAGAIGSPAILLRSGVPGDVVGKRTFLHPVVVSSGIYKDPVYAC
jgi:choline dehydrogenase-like flavoprotein